MAQNLGDVVLLGEDKSILEGIDKDFLVNTAFTSATIQGPGMGGNLYNMIKDEVADRGYRQRTNKRRTRAYEITLALQDRGSLTSTEQKALVKEQREILAAEALDEVMTTNKFNRLSEQEQAALFDLNRRRRKVLRNIRAEAGKGDTRTLQQRKNKSVQIVTGKLISCHHFV